MSDAAGVLLVAAASALVGVVVGLAIGDGVGFRHHAQQTCARHGEQLVYVSEQHTYCEGDAGVVLR